jgi:D-glucosaminate-6-phosphate ammonia-lyase
MDGAKKDIEGTMMGRSPLNRRLFLQCIGSLAGVRIRNARASAQPNSGSRYRELGVTPFINAAGAYTDFGGALMPDEVLDAMREVSQHSVSITELQQAVSRKIAAMLGCEAALVTSGCASSLTLATAACVAGKDADKIRRLPDTAGSKNEVILQRSHRFDYDHAIRNAGVHLVEVETAEELGAAVNERTAMLFFLNSANAKGKIQRQQFVRLATAVKVPALIDAAADLPPVENLWSLIGMGFDLVAFSGGKSLRGPQCSGLLLGRKELIEAAFLNGPPHSDSLGRITKVGKEEIVGLYRALQLFVTTDHAAEWSEWERRVSVIAREIRGVRGVTSKRVVPEIPHHRPQLHLNWDSNEVSLTAAQLSTILRSGEPRIELPPMQGLVAAELDVAVWMLRPGEDIIVGRRIREALLQGQQAQKSPTS